MSRVRCLPSSPTAAEGFNMRFEEWRRSKERKNEFPKCSSAADCCCWVVASPAGSSLCSSSLLLKCSHAASWVMSSLASQMEACARASYREDAVIWGGTGLQWRPEMLSLVRRRGAFRDPQSFRPGQCIIIWDPQQKHNVRVQHVCCSSGCSVELRRDVLVLVECTGL